MPQWGSTAFIEREIIRFIEEHPEGITYEDLKVKFGRRVKNNPTTLVFHNAIKFKDGKYYPILTRSVSISYKHSSKKNGGD